jgi:alanyl-tRNA synthetase
LKSKLATRGGVLSGVVDLPELDGEAIRELGDRAKSLSKDVAVVLFGRQEGRVPFLVACEGAALERGLKAGDVAKAIAAQLGGGGGGRPNLAQGQGLDAGKVTAALDDARRALDAKLGA